VRQPVKPWQGVRAADKFGPACIQSDDVLMEGASIAEDIAALSVGKLITGVAGSMVDGKVVTEAPEVTFAARRQAIVPVIYGVNDRGPGRWDRPQRGCASLRSSVQMLQRPDGWLARTYWMSFANTGDPNGGGRAQWPRHDPGADKVINFTNAGALIGPRPAEGAAGPMAEGVEPERLRVPVPQPLVPNGGSLVIAAQALGRLYSTGFRSALRAISCAGSDVAFHPSFGIPSSTQISSGVSRTKIGS
jgi:hypothetical protein